MKPTYVDLNLFDAASGEVGARIELNRPERNNALVPELLGALNYAIDQALKQKCSVIILSGNGQHFSTGGDLTEFTKQTFAGSGASYARKLVGLLQEAVYKMLSSPAIFIVAAQGAITGGSSGLLFASDISIVEETAFLQPYYREVGFGPDGGWTAVLPEIVGARRAMSLQLQNSRIGAQELVSLNIAQTLVGNGQATAIADQTADELLNSTNVAAMVSAKKLTWHPSKLRQIRENLDAETEEFVRLFQAPHMVTTLCNFKPSRAS